VRPTGEWLNQPGGLAERLRRIRKAAGLTGDALAEQLGWSRSKVPKLENGRQMPTDQDIGEWAAACGAPEAAAELLDMLAEAQSVHRQYRHQLRRGHLAIQEDLDELVRSAKIVRNFEVMFVPGLLQTPGYARSRYLQSVRVHGFPAERVEESIGARIRRQGVLYEGQREFEFVLMETALLVRSCPAPVMLEQLDRLQSAAGLPRVTLGIIPLAAELAVTPDMGFLVADDTAYIETPTSEDFLFGEEAAKYGRIADELRAEAVAGEEARDLIMGASRRLRMITAAP
jgi:transcriptional regulator with XRE-family HTH domain